MTGPGPDLNIAVIIATMFCCHLNVFMSHNIGCIKLNVDLCKHALAVGYQFGHNGYPKCIIL